MCRAFGVIFCVDVWPGMGYEHNVHWFVRFVGRESKTVCVVFSVAARTLVALRYEGAGSPSEHLF